MHADPRPPLRQLPQVLLMAACPLHPEIERPCWQCGANHARAAIRTRPAHTTDTNPTRARAIERARQDRTNAKEQP